MPVGSLWTLRDMSGSQMRPIILFCDSVPRKNNWVLSVTKKRG
jgi:hypothetical protein